MVDKISTQTESIDNVQSKLIKIVEKSNTAYSGAKEIQIINHTIHANFEVTVNMNSLNELSKQLNDIVARFEI